MRTRTNGEINLASRIAKKPEVLPLVEKLRAKGWRNGKIADWLDENGHSGRFRLKAWLDADKTKPVRTEYADTAEELRQIADTAFEKRIYRRARLAEFSPKRDNWKNEIAGPPSEKSRKRRSGNRLVENKTNALNSRRGASTCDSYRTLGASADGIQLRI